MVEEKKYKERALTPHAFPILKFVPRSVILLETRAALFKTRFKGRTRGWFILRFLALSSDASFSCAYCKRNQEDGSSLKLKVKRKKISRKE